MSRPDFIFRTSLPRMRLILKGITSLGCGVPRFVPTCVISLQIILFIVNQTNMLIYFMNIYITTHLFLVVTALWSVLFSSGRSAPRFNITTICRFEITIVKMAANSKLMPECWNDFFFQNRISRQRKYFPIK